jgi:hypothetical protein|nr:MAG TPA: hypothetical protein [Caudoviricetes sp.]
MITDEQGREWLFQKLYDDGWRYYVRNIGGVAHLTTKKPVMTGNILEVTSGGTTKCVNAIRSIMPKIDRCGILDIAEELGIVDWSKVKVDTPILVSNDNKEWIKRYFARYENGNVYGWLNGKTSWTATGELSIGHWNYAKLAEV